MGLRGFVTNTTKGVLIVASGTNVSKLVDILRSRATHVHTGGLARPPVADIASVSVRPSASVVTSGFRIVASQTRGCPETEPLPDISTCSACRKEIRSPGQRRHGYAFTNCTQCGPRFTIMLRPPYDRVRTTMSRFRMCPQCAAEYSSPTDRRFHAQPIACPTCGPRLSLLDSKAHAIQGDPLTTAAKALLQGKVVAIKGLGGFHLFCDASNTRAVQHVQRCKLRDFRPLAVMCATVGVARAICRITAEERSALTSRAAPIVLLCKRTHPRLMVSPVVAPNNPCYGVMLPYTPLHILLFERLRSLGRPHAILVATSANRSDQPMSTTVEELLRSLASPVDLILTNNRDIANRCDDSVVSARLGITIRRARGYAPTPLRLSPAFHVKQHALALGGDMRVAPTLAKGDLAFVASHVGSVAPGPGEDALRNAVDTLLSWTGARPAFVACDLHPDYWTSRLAFKMSAELGARLVRVQHHFAHTLSVMAEHRLTGPVLGLACDGTGFGTDGHIWGCELLLVQHDLSWRRLSHLGYMELADAGSEVPSPARVASSYLAQLGLGDAIGRLGLPRPVRTARGIRTSSLGRLFDAAAAITGVCRDSTFEGAAPMALESIAARTPMPLVPAPLSPKELIGPVVADMLAGNRVSIVAGRFHSAVAAALAAAVVRAARVYRIRRVCLSGGSFQNARLLTMVRGRLQAARLAVYHNRSVPLNDGGVSLGQALATTARKLPVR